MVTLLVCPKTIVFGRTYVLAQMFISPPVTDSLRKQTYVLAQMFFIFFPSLDLRDAWSDWLEILYDGQYYAEFYNTGPKFWGALPYLTLPSGWTGYAPIQR